MSEPECNIFGRQGPTHELLVLRHQGVGRWMLRLRAGIWGESRRGGEKPRGRNECAAGMLRVEADLVSDQVRRSDRLG